MAPPDTIEIEVVYATRDRQQILTLTLPVGTTAGEALRRAVAAGLVLDAGDAVPPIGVFGEPVEPVHRLVDRDRLEIYRPLIADPRTQRRQRARGA